MKLKFVLVPLAVLGLAVGSYAEGFSWVNPSQKNCVGYGGKIKEGKCEAEWSNAKDICSASSARLPSILELRKVIVDCGGVVRDYDNNKVNSSYQSCYKREGFTFKSYWSSSTHMSDSSIAWFVYFKSGGDGWNARRKTEHIVRCIKGGQ